MQWHVSCWLWDACQAVAEDAVEKRDSVAVADAVAEEGAAERVSACFERCSTTLRQVASAGFCYRV